MKSRHLDIKRKMRRVAGICALFSSLANAATPLPTLQLQVEKAARETLLAQAAKQDLTDAEVSVTVLMPATPPASCPQRYEIVPADTRFLARMRFTARCPSTGTAVDLIVRAELLASVLVATADIAAGKPIAGDSVTLEKRNISNAQDALANVEELQNQASRRAIRTGQIVQRRMLQPLQLVRRNQSVHIVARREQVEVTVPGIALDNGGQDDIIRVRNVGTGRVISARVTALGTVEPAGELPSANQPGD